MPYVTWLILHVIDCLNHLHIFFLCSNMFDYFHIFCVSSVRSSGCISHQNGLCEVHWYLNMCVCVSTDVREHQICAFVLKVLKLLSEGHDGHQTCWRSSGTCPFCYITSSVSEDSGSFLFSPTLFFLYTLIFTSPSSDTLDITVFLDC